MSFKDFEGKERWKIKNSTAQCRVGELVTIAGPEHKVTVSCDKVHAYTAAAYDRTSSTVQSELFTLTLQGEDLHCNYKGGPRGITGSWTAEDIGSQGTGA